LLKQILKEQAEINRILRGHGKIEDRTKIETIDLLKQSFPKYTKDMIGVELEILQQTLLNRLQ
jgi:hypothetical protein